MEVFECADQLPEHMLTSLLSEPLMLDNKVGQVAPTYQLHHDIKVFFAFKSRHDPRAVYMVDFLQCFQLLLHVLDASSALSLQEVFADNFYGEFFT